MYVRVSEAFILRIIGRVGKILHLKDARQRALSGVKIIRECSCCFVFEWRAVRVIILKKSKQKYMTCTCTFSTVGQAKVTNQRKESFY